MRNCLNLLKAIILAPLFFVIFSCANPAGADLGGNGGNSFVDNNAVSQFRVSDPNWLKGRTYYCVKQLGGGQEIQFLGRTTRALFIEFDSSSRAFTHKESHNDGGNDSVNCTGTYTFDPETLTGVLTCTGSHSFYEGITDFPFTISKDGKTLTYSVEVEHEGQRGMYTCIWKLTGKEEITGRTIPSANSLWEPASGSSGTDFGYWTNTDDTRWIRIQKKGFAANDKIIISYRQSSTFTNYQSIQMAGAYHGNWDETYLRNGTMENAYGVDGGENLTEFNIVPYDEDEGKIVYKLTSDDAVRINNNYGLAVYGCGVKITKVETTASNLIDSLEDISVPRASQEIYSGNYDLNNWNSYLKLYYKNFSGNDVIYISYVSSSLNPGRAGSLDCMLKLSGIDVTNWNAFKDGIIENGYFYQENLIHLVKADSTSRIISYKLTSAEAELLNQNKGLVVWGNAVKINSIKVAASRTLETSLISFPDDGVTVYEGENDFGYWNRRSVDENSGNVLADGDVWMRLYYTGFSAGDQIRITHTASDIWNEWYRLEMCAIDSLWVNTKLRGGRIDNGSVVSGWPTQIEPITCNQTTAYTLTAQDAANLNNCKGLVIMGGGLKITKVVFKTANLLYANSYKNGWRGNEYGGGVGSEGSGSSRKLHFTRTLKKYGYSESLDKKDPEKYKEFKFYYTFNSATNTISINRAYKVEYEYKGEFPENYQGSLPEGAERGEGSGNGTVYWYKLTPVEITGLGSFTARWTIDQGAWGNGCIEFTSVPEAGDLSSYFVTGVKYDFTDNPLLTSIDLRDEDGNEISEPMEIEKGSNVTLSLVFSDFETNPTNLNVYVHRDSENSSDICVAENVSVTNGKITFPVNVNSGTYRIKVKPVSGYGTMVFEKRILVTDPARPRSVSLSVQNSTVTIGENLVLNVGFTNFTTNPSTVELHDSATTSAGNIPVSNGRITLPTATASAGPYTIYVVADGVQSNEIRVTLAAPVTPDPAVIEPDVERTILWKGSNDFGGTDASMNSTRLELLYSNFNAGDKILVTHTNSTSAPNSNKHQFKMYGVHKDPGSYSFKTGAVSSNASMDNGKIRPSSYTQTSTYTLTATDLESIKDDNSGHGGIGIEGNGLTITEVAVQKVNSSNPITADCSVNGWEVLTAAGSNASAKIAFVRSRSDLQNATAGMNCSSFLKWYEFNFTTSGGNITITRISDVPWTCVGDGEQYDIMQQGKKYRRGTPTVYNGSWSAVNSGGVGDFKFCFNALPDDVKAYISTGVYYPITAGVNGGSSSGESEDSFTPRYRGTLSGSLGTVYIIMTINPDTLAVSTQGYTDSTYSRTTDVGTMQSTMIPGSDEYSFSMNFTIMGSQQVSMYGRVSEDRMTMQCTGTFAGTLSFINE